MEIKLQKNVDYDGSSDTSFEIYYTYGADTLLRIYKENLFVVRLIQVSATDLHDPTRLVSCLVARDGDHVSIRFDRYSTYKINVLYTYDWSLADRLFPETKCLEGETVI